jgi:Oxidoreductase molybdopterin binding domain
MTPSRIVHAALLVAVLAAPAAAQTAPMAVPVVNLDGATINVPLEGLTRHVVTASDHGAQVAFEGVLVGDVLAKAGVVMGEKLRGPGAMARYVLATARDGYTTVFALAELDPGISESAILIADRRDGKRLDEKAGPLQIVSPYEKRAGRWIRQLARLDVREAK